MIKVETFSIDDWCASHNVAPTLLKIDVEGAEDRVLQGMLDTMARHRPNIIIDECTDEAARRLKDARYQLCSLDTDDGHPVKLTKLGFTVIAIHREPNRSPLQPIR